MAILKQRQTINAGGTRRRRHARTTRGKNKRDRRRENIKRYEGLFDLIRKQQKNKLENDSLDNTMFVSKHGMTNLTRKRTESEKNNLRWFETGDKHCDEAVKNAIIQEDKKYQDEITALPWASWAKKTARSTLDPQLVRRATAAGKKTWYQCKNINPPLPRTKRLEERNKQIGFNPELMNARHFVHPDGSTDEVWTGREVRSGENKYANQQPVVESDSITMKLPPRIKKKLQKSQKSQKSQKASDTGGLIKKKSPRKTKRKTKKRK